MRKRARVAPDGVAARAAEGSTVLSRIRREAWTRAAARVGYAAPFGALAGMARPCGFRYEATPVERDFIGAASSAIGRAAG